MDKEKCGKRVNGECGKALNCVWCPERFTNIKKVFSQREIRRKKAIKNHKKNVELDCRQPREDGDIWRWYERQIYFAI